MNCIFRIFLTLAAVSWMLAIYGIKEQWQIICCLPSYITGLILVVIPVLVSSILIRLMKYFEIDELKDITECILADNEFLPVYLGYFFVALSINNNITFIFIFIIVFIFTFLSQYQYFNPIFLLFGYHFYHVRTAYGTRIFVINNGPVIRNIQNNSLKKCFRLNDITFIGKP